MATGARTALALSLDAVGDRPCMAVVRRGEQETYRFLQQEADGRRLVEIRWDRRTRDRRSVRQSVLPERRQRDRRRTMPETWSTLGFAIVPLPVEADAAPAVTGPIPAPARGPRGLRPSAAWPEQSDAPAAWTRPSASLRPLTGVERNRARVVALVQVPGAIMPGFYDPARGGWRCPRCEQLLGTPGPEAPIPRAGHHCVGCQAAIIRVLRRRWQRVNWLGLTAAAILALLGAHFAWPLVGRLL